MTVEQPWNPDEASLLETLRFVSKAAVSLLVAIAVVCAYLLQRTGQILVFGLDPLSPQPQLSQLGLDFSYLTLSAAWPIVLGVLCTSYCIVARKRIQITEHLNHRGIPSPEIAMLDPFFFTAPKTLSIRLLFWLLGVAPVASILLVFGAQLSVTLSRLLAGSADTTFAASQWVPVGAWIPLNLVVQCLAVAVGMALAWPFRGSLTVLVET